MNPPTSRPPCRFCKELSIVRVAIPQGCFCYPDDREQDLCDHHVQRATPLGEMTVIHWYKKG